MVNESLEGHILLIGRKDFACRWGPMGHDVRLGNVGRNGDTQILISENRHWPGAVDLFVQTSQNPFGRRKEVARGRSVVQILNVSDDSGT